MTNEQFHQAWFVFAEGKVHLWIAEVFCTGKDADAKVEFELIDVPLDSQDDAPEHYFLHARRVFDGQECDLGF